MFKTNKKGPVAKREIQVNIYGRKYGRSRCGEDLHTPVGMIDQIEDSL